MKSDIDQLIEAAKKEFDGRFINARLRYPDVAWQTMKGFLAEKMREAYKAGRQESEDSDAVKMNRDFWNS